MQNSAHIRAAQQARAALDSSLVKHTRFADALKQIESALLFPTDIRLIWVIGPTGAGKTRLLRSVENLVMKIIEKKLVDDPGCVPFVSFDVPCPDLGHRFSWAEHHYRYLEKLEVPLTLSGAPVSPLPKSDPKRGLENIVVNAMKHRRPLVTLLDETNHFASVTSAKVLYDQTNRIKSFVSRTNVLHVCCGTYEVARMAAVSGQLARRSDIIHFSRYRAESPADCAAFRGIVRTFQQCLPVVHHLDLLTHAKFLHERSIGCVGVLKGWLIKALAHANVEGRAEVSLGDIQATAMPINRLRIMLDDAVKGEQSLQGDCAQLDLFRKELGHDTDSTDNVPPADDLFATPAPVAAPSPKSPVKPFELAPNRLPIGGAFNGDRGKLAM